MSKPITFKTAILIVFALHVVGFFLLTQIASIRTNLSRISWHEKKQQLLKQDSSSNNWPQPNKPIITSVPTNKEKKATEPKTKPKVVTENKPSTPTAIPTVAKTILPKSVPPTSKKETAMKFIESKMRETSSPKIVSSIQVTRIGNDIQTETVERRVIRTSFVDSSSRTREITIVPVY